MTIYFPVLRWKMGERGALANLDPAIKRQISPIIGFPIDCDYTDNKVANFCNSVVSDWGIDQSFYLDLSAVDYTSAPTGIDHPALGLFRAAHEEGLQVIPVISPGMDPDLFIAIQQAYSADYFESAGIRIDEDVDDLTLLEVDDMINSFDLTRETTDLIIDLADISSGVIQAKVRVLNALISLLGTGFRNTIIICGAMPGNLQNYVGTDEEAELLRYDWQLWQRVRNHQNISHVLFGDYTVIPYEFREVRYQGAPRIRYTLYNSWHIIKGHKPRGRDNQRQLQSQRIIALDSYRGSDYSFGDNRIFDCANGNWGPGNPTNWVAIDVNQHITYVVSQVSEAIAAP